MPTKTSAVAVAVGAMLAVPVTPAWAGGLARPNLISARGVGMGGAFSAIADDPTALHFNPAGLARLRKSNIMIGGEFVVAPRSYEPKFDGDVCEGDDPPARCQSPQEPTAPIRPVPSLGFATKLTREGQPTGIAVGIGFWNTFGGQLEYEDEVDIPGTLQKSRNVVLELVPGAAYEVNDVLSVGAALRIGIGLFDSESFERPSSAELSASGFGAGATIGILITPSQRLAVGAYYRTPLTVTTTGDGVIEQSTGLLDVELEFVQPWPQQAGISVAVKPTDKLTLAAQFDWHGWQRVNALEPTFEGEQELTRQVKIETDWNNNFAIHGGIEYAPTDRVALRGGYTFDSNAMIDRLRERQTLDGDAMYFATGTSVYLTKSLRVDAAFEYGPGGTTTIDDNSDEVAAWRARRNLAPGDHSGQLYTFELAVQYLY